MYKSSVIDALIVQFANAVPYFYPSDFCHFLQAFITQVGVKSFIGTKGVDGICHGIDVPIVNFDYFIKNFAECKEESAKNLENSLDFYPSFGYNR